MTSPTGSTPPAYVRIATEWAERIDSGELQHGDPLPTREELAEQYGVSKTVIRDALSLLHQDGYLHSATRRGTRVFRLRRFELPMYVLESDDRGRDAYEDAVREQGGEPGQRIEVHTVAPAEDVAKALRLEDGQLALVRMRVRTIDSIPYCTADSYFPFHLVQGSDLVNPANIQRGGRHLLREMGLEMVLHRDRIRSRRPRSREITDLGIPSGLPIIRHDRVSYTADGTPVRFMTSAFPSDRWEITYEVEK